MDTAEKLCIAAAIGLFLWQLWLLVMAMRSAHWRGTPCEILSLDEEEHEATDTLAHAPTYSAKVRYRYMVDGAHYESSRLSYRSTSGLSQKQARNLIERIHSHKPMAYYNPRTPSQAVLIRSADWGNYLGCLIPLALGGATLVQL